MRRHWKAFAILETLMLALFVGGAASGRLVLAICSVLIGVIALFVMAVAWMRPEGYPPEHHPAVDRIVDDTRP